MTDQLARANRFRELHARPEPLLLPNPWDAGSAKLLANLGFEALATTSLGAGCVDGTTMVSPVLVLENCRDICAATDLPVNVDLENCFADDPEDAAKTFSLACETGAVGGSIEDATGRPGDPIYEFGLSVARVEASVAAARALPVPFTLTALLHGVTELGPIIERLQAFEAAGADVLYAPGLRTIEQMKTVAAAVGKPLNVVMGFADPAITLDQLADIGVRRISIGAGLARVALKAAMGAARDMKAGCFGFVGDMIDIAELRAAFGESG